MPVQKIRTFLWFNDNAEAAITFYTSVFKNSKAGAMNRMPDGRVMLGEFEIEDRQFIALNGGPQFKFNESISLFVTCESQDEVDYYWSKLTADGGEESRCGWLKDKFGLSWQIIPSALTRLMGDKDRVKANRVMQAMLQMQKIDIAALERAYGGD